MTAKNKRASEPRRANKPLMEKRRRARINQSLAALKTLILDTAKADNTKHSKLEKADILELTVRHFQRHRSLDVKGVNQYKSGYTDCVREVQRYLETPDAQTMTLLDAGVKQRLLRHLDNCVSEVDVDIRSAATVQLSPHHNSTEERLQQPTASLPAQPPSEINILEEVNNNLNNTRLMPPETKSTTAIIENAIQNNKMVKNYDGNFVLLLPEHYVQLASALGVNLRPSSNDNNASVSGSSSENQAGESLSLLNGKVEQTEKPLDFSKNNDGNGDMWRPW